MLIPSAAYAGTEDHGKLHTITQFDVQQAQKKATKKFLPKLALPNVAALTAKLLRADRHVIQRQLAKSRQVLAFWERHKWMLAPRKEKCWEVPWQRSCTVARASYRLHSTLESTASRKLWYTLPETNDWRTAVRIAQRVFPGTEGWLLSCSKTEGGWGEFVMNREGSGVGGNMQMYPSTFWRMWGAGAYNGAIDYMRALGFAWPASAASWYSPLGQALASAWGVTHGRRGEWHGSGC